MVPNSILHKAKISFDSQLNEKLIFSMTELPSYCIIVHQIKLKYYPLVILHRVEKFMET